MKDITGIESAVKEFQRKNGFWKILYFDTSTYHVWCSYSEPNLYELPNSHITIISTHHTEVKELKEEELQHFIKEKLSLILKNIMVNSKSENNKGFGYDL